MPPFPFVGWAATDAFAQSHVQTIVDFTKAYLLGVRWVTNPANRQAAIDLLVKNTNSGPADAAKTYDVSSPRATRSRRPG